MAAADCTIIVPTFNRAAFVGETLDSLLTQSWPPGQIIVVNDGSTDETLALLKKFGNHIEVVDKQNGGKATALNKALPMVRHGAVWIFDDDDIALPDGLERHLDALNHFPDVGFTISGMQIGRAAADGQLEIIGSVIPPRFSQHDLFLRLMEGSFIEGQPAAMIRTACLIEAGPFNERLVRSEDYDMFLRLARRFSAVRVEQPTFIQRRHIGPRGNASLVYDGSDRHAQWSLYNRLFLVPLLEETPLNEFVPRNLTFDHRQALVQRFSIAMRHGLLEIAERDLTDILQLEGPDLSAIERDILSRALTFFTALRETGVKQCRRIANLSPGRLGAQIRWHMARGLAYEAIGFSRQFRLAEATALASRIMVLAGSSGIHRMLIEKIKLA